MKRRWLRRSAFLLLVLLVAVVAVLGWLTRPGALCAHAASVAQRYGLRLTRLDGVSFTPWGGLSFRGLSLTRPQADPSVGLRALRVRDGRIALPLSAWLGRRPRVSAIELREPSITLVCRPATSSGRWLDNADRAEGLVGPIDALPRLTISNADIQILEAGAGGERLVQRVTLSADGRVAPGATPAYELQIRQVGGASLGPRARRGDSLAELRWDGNALTCRMGWLDLTAVAPLLPADTTRALRDWNASGRFRVGELRQTAGRLDVATVELDDVALAIPVESDAAGEDRFMQLHALCGALTLADEDLASDSAERRVTGQLSGRLRDGALRVDATARLRAAPAHPPQGLPFHDMRADVAIDSVTLPTASDFAGFITSERLPAPVRAFFRDYQPAGPVSLRLNMRQLEAAPTAADAGASPAWEASGELIAVGASCRYDRFPYLMSDARGRVLFSKEGLVFDGLRARHGDAVILADGRLDNSHPWTGFDLRFRGTGVALDAELYAALPAEYQELWRETDLAGVCDLDVALTRADGRAAGRPRPAAARIDANLIRGRVRGPDGATLDKASGAARIENGVVTIHNLRGAIDGATVQAQGELRAQPGGGFSRDLTFSASNYALAREFTIADATGQALGSIAFSGRGDVEGRLRSASEERESGLSATVREGRLTGFDGSVWPRCAGEIAQSPEGLRIRDFRAEDATSSLEAEGLIAPGGFGAGPCDLRVVAKAQAIEGLLARVVPARWRELCASLGLSGAGELRGDYTGDAAGKASGALRVSAAGMRLRVMPLELRDVTAELALRSEGFEIRQARARLASGGELELSGGGAWGAGEWARLRVAARDVALEPQVVTALPGGLSALLQRLQARGRLSLTLERAEKSADDWRFAGRVRVADAGLRIGVDLEGCDGELDGECAIGPAGLHVAARVAIPSGKLHARELRDLTGFLRVEPGDAWARIEEASAAWCEGEVSGQVRVNADSGAYEMLLNLNDVNFNKLLGRAAGAGASGRLDGRVFINRAADDPPGWSGGGDLRIRGASLLNTAATASVLEARRVQNPALADEVDEAVLRVVFEGRVLRLTRIDIRTGDTRLVGEGSWNIDSDAIEMTLVAAHPKHAARVAVLTDLLETAGQELVQYHVTGRAARPRVTAEPLHRLNDALRRLLALPE